jgi:hypothetical protein
VRAGAGHRIGATLAVGLAAFAIGLPSAVAGADPAPASPPGTACGVFPADNIWNTDVSRLPVDPHSADWMATMRSGSTNLHPDFGGKPYGMPFNVVDESYPKVKVRFHYRSESDRKRYPFGADTKIERGSDRHALMIDADTCVLYELFAADWNGGAPKAGSGAIFDLGSNALRADGWTSADAAGLPIFPGLVRYDEVKAGFIGHAIRFTAELTDCHHLWPARHDAGTCDARYPPMGARFRLRSSFDISAFGHDAKVILRAMKTYGLILADNGSNWYFQGTMDERWKDSLLDQLKSIPASAFEAIDESGCMIDPNSAEASCP